MKIMKDLMLQNGTDIDEIRKIFFASGDDCIGSIFESKKYIIGICRNDKLSIWDVVRNQHVEIDNDKDFSAHQKMMVKASMLLAWEELERDNEELCLQIHEESKKAEA